MVFHELGRYQKSGKLGKRYMRYQCLLQMDRMKRRKRNRISLTELLLQIILERKDVKIVRFQTPRFLHRTVISKEIAVLFLLALLNCVFLTG